MLYHKLDPSICTTYKLNFLHSSCTGRQLQTLCDVQVSLITFKPKTDDQLQSQPPEIWLPESNKFLSQIQAFKSQSMEEKMKKTFKLENYLEEKCKKLEESILNQRIKNHRNWYSDYNDLSEEKLLQIVYDMDSKLQSIDDKLSNYESHEQPDYQQLYFPNTDNQLLSDQGTNLVDDYLISNVSTISPDLMVTSVDNGSESIDVNWIENSEMVQNNWIENSEMVQNNWIENSEIVQNNLMMTSPLMMQTQIEQTNNLFDDYLSYDASTISHDLIVTSVDNGFEPIDVNLIENSEMVQNNLLMTSPLMMQTQIEQTDNLFDDYLSYDASTILPDLMISLRDDEFETIDASWIENYYDDNDTMTFRQNTNYDGSCSFGS